MTAGVSPQGNANEPGPLDRPPRLPTSELLALAAPYNPRTIDDDALAALQSSLQSFGWVTPAVVNVRPGGDLVMVGGHQRAIAAEAIGLEDGPVVWTDLGELQEKALNLALNKISGRWDDDLLGQLLEDLSTDAADLIPATGFSAQVEDILDEFKGAIDHSPIDPAQLFGAPPEVDAPPPEAAPPDDPNRDPRLAFGGATSMTRGSAPMRLWRSRKHLRGRVLDFGAGLDKHRFQKYDPFHHPDPAPLLETWDVVVCNYVLNVQPAEHLVTQIAVLLRRLVEPDTGLVLVAVRADAAGGWSRRGFQAKRSLEEWLALLDPIFGSVKATRESSFYAFECRP